MGKCPRIADHGTHTKGNLQKDAIYLSFSFLFKVVWQPDQGVTVGVQRRSGRRVSSSRQPEVREERWPATQRALVRDVRHLRSAVGGVARQEGQGPVTSL